MYKKDANQRKGVSRRGFLKRSAGLTALAVPGGGLSMRSHSLLAACKSAGTESISGFCDGCLYKKCMTKYNVKDVGSADGEVQADVGCSIDKGGQTVKVDARNSTLFSNSEWESVLTFGEISSMEAGYLEPHNKTAVVATLEDN